MRIQPQYVIAAVACIFAIAMLDAQAPAPPTAAGTANPELVGALSKALGSTPTQAEGAAGALFGLAQSRMKPADWAKVAAAIPGMDRLLKAAPSLVGTAGAAAALPGAAGLGGLSSVAGAFSSLGLKPEMATKAVPVLTSFVTKSGGADVGGLLAAALK